MIKTFYEILGIEKDASKEDIQKAYKDKAKEHHPDIGGDQEEFIQLVEAYETLIDEDKRKEYDETGKIKDSVSISDVANSVVQTYFKKFLGSGEGILKIDVFREIRKLLSLDEKRNLLGRRRLKAQIKLINNIKDRIKRGGTIKTTPIEELLDEEYLGIQKKIRQTNYQSLVNEVIQRILDDYTYIFDKKEKGDA